MTAVGGESTGGTQGAETAPERCGWMSILARASESGLETAWAETDPKPAYHLIRPPETGLVMVQARAGGTGERFNFGEMTVTRCAIRIEGGAVGHAYVAGACDRHAEIAAVFDGMLQDPGRHAELLDRVVAPLAAAEAERKREIDSKTAATRVDFFTLVRGEDG